MRRSKFAHIITYAKLTRGEEGKLEISEDKITINEYNEEKAIKIAKRKVGDFQVVSVERISETWELSDEDFFKYAHKVEG